YLIYLYGIVIFATIRKYIRFIEVIPSLKYGIIMYNIIQYIVSVFLSFQIIIFILNEFLVKIFNVYITTDNLIITQMNYIYVIKKFVCLLIISLYNNIPHGIIPNLRSIIFEHGLIVICALYYLHWSDYYLWFILVDTITLLIIPFIYHNL